MNNLVVLVDDDSVTNVLNEKIIRNSGFLCDVVIVQDSKEALVFLSKNVAEDYDQAFIFLDYQMPNLNGIDILRHLDQNTIENSNIQLFFLTSSDKDALLVKINSNPRVSKVLTKPLTPMVVNSIFQAQHELL